MSSFKKEDITMKLERRMGYVESRAKASMVVIYPLQKKKRKEKEQRKGKTYQRFTS